MRRSGSALLAIAFAIQGCDATCKQACEKLLECEEVENARMSQTDCEDSCSREVELYKMWDDTDKQHRLDEERNCIVDSSCEDVAAGVCYDEELFAFPSEEDSG